jgi:hypothetical protein
LSHRGDPTAQADLALPPIVARALVDPAPPPMPWYRGIGPAYLTLFIWAPFFDQLWVGDIARAGLGPLFVSALLGPLLCFGFFFMAASWGFQLKRPLVVVAASAFGASGAEWLCGILIALAAAVWYALAINFAVDSTLLGLRACGMLAPSGVAMWSAGPLQIKAPVFLLTALFWIYITRQAIRLRLSGVVVGLMKVYSPIAVLLLIATALWRLPILWSTSDLGAAASRLLSASVYTPPRESALGLMTGFFAASALLSIDWGAAVRTRKDIVIAGVPYLLLTAALASILSLLVVLETAAWRESAASLLSPSRIDPMPFSFRWALYEGSASFPRGVATAILILFGLAALAPAVGALQKVSEGVSIHWPAFTPRGVSAIVGLGALLLIATGQVDRLGPIYTGMGAIFAPALGAMAGHSSWRIERRFALRRGANPAGLLAWAAGCLVACAAWVFSNLQSESSVWAQAGSIDGFIVSACAYWLLSRAGLESAALPVGNSGIEG